jgi:hypothetical protein
MIYREFIIRCNASYNCTGFYVIFHVVETERCGCFVACAYGRVVFALLCYEGISFL